LDFDEFCALMQSFDAVGAVARRRGSAYGLTPEQRGDYSDAEVVLLSHHFGIFDKDGSGGIDAKELRGALDALGFAVSPEKLRTLLTIADADRSGVVEFGEFAALMRRLGDGSLLLDALPNTGFSAREMQKHGVPLGRLNLAADFEKLQELGIGEYPPFLVDVQTAATEPEPSVYATFAGSTLAGTPYAGRAVKLCIRATELYPLTAPVAFFTCRLVHLNCDVRLDGTARPSQLLREWVSGASLEELLRRAHALLVEPDADLFHRAQAALRAPPSDTSGPPGMDLRCSRRASKFTADVGALFEQNRPAYDALVRIEAVKALEKWDAAPKPQIEPA